MARLARIVLPGIAHHVTQRGNRRLPVFFSDDDFGAYRDLIAASCHATATRCLAWCLMHNHVHLILVPETADGLRGALADAHRRYSRMVNFREGWTGYLWQGRFASYPMDDAHLMAAVRYVERNPVEARLVARAEDWRWSSARAHVTGVKDGLTDIAALGEHVANWRSMLAEGFEASDRADAAIERHTRTGRPLGNATWVERLETASGRVLSPMKRGPKSRAADGDRGRDPGHYTN